MKEKDHAFFAGICVALQHVSLYDCVTVWRDIVQSVGFDDLKHYVTKIEPEEFDLTGFKKYAKSEFGKTVHKPNQRH